VREYVLTLLVTAAVTYLLTPLVRRGAIKAGAIHAARDRDVHVVPIPLLGGIAMYGGMAAGLWLAGRLVPLGSVFYGTRMASGLMLAGGLIVIVGFVDDRWGMNPLSKLAGQVAAGAILVWSQAQLTWIPVPGGGSFFLTSNQSTALTILLVVATINAVNFIDGLDGLAAGIICIAAVSFFLYYYTLTKVQHLSAEAGPALAAAVLAGACIGFLPHNFYPARIFMGDTGAMLLGLLLAYVPISSIASLNPSSLAPGAVNRFPEILPLLLPAAIMVIPYGDVVLAIVRRTRAGQSPFAPDRGHLHHRLLDIGHSQRASVLIMYLWAALFSSAVVWLSVARTPLIVLAVTTVLAVLLLLMMSMPRLRWWERQRLSPAGPQGEVLASRSPAAAAAEASASVTSASVTSAPVKSAAPAAPGGPAPSWPAAAAPSAPGMPAPPWPAAVAPSVPGVSARPR